MSATPSESPPPPGQALRSAFAQAELARAKRKLATVEDKLAQITGQKRKKSSDINEGRRLCRLVSLFDSIRTLIEEADRRFASEQDEEEAHEGVHRERERQYTGYILLLRSIPRVKDLIEDPEQEDALDSLIPKLQHGANEGRRDDLRRILSELPQWLNDIYSPTRPFSLKNRRDRGLQNDITGRLLCPIEYNWDDESTRADIRNGKISIFDDYYLSCFYPKGTGNGRDVEVGFLRSRLLIKTFCAIFTAPSSADAFEDEGEDGPARKKLKSDTQKRATKSTVADIIGMEGTVTPRSIAHAAVMLAFNLTDCEQWRSSYNGFSYRGLYNFIVDFFEDVEPDDTVTQRKVDQLLLWWNQQIFPDHIAVATDSQKSSSKLKEQRARRAAIATRT